MIFLLTTRETNLITTGLKRPAAVALLALAGWQGHALAGDQAPAKAAGGTARQAAVADFSKCDKPVWPQEALRREQTGVVTMAFKIGADGSVEASKVTKSSGYPLLDEAARFGIAKCKFQPGTHNGKAESAWMQMQYVWTLSDDAGNPAAQAVYAETRAAAEAGDVEAQLKLGQLFQQGRGVRRDDVQALEWLSKAAESGSAEAQFRLAALFLVRENGPVSAQQAHEWLLKAAEQGHAMAMMGLAGLYASGRGTPRDPKQAFVWLHKAADAGVVRALAALAWAYQTGNGVERDPDEALRLLRQGAELDDLAAVQGLGIELYRSQSPRDHEEAVPLLQKAADKGWPPAQTLLGKAYREGRGVPADVALGTEWVRKAAAQSHVEAQFLMAEMLEQGSGVRKDDAEALRLYELAAQRGWVPAVQRMVKVAERGELGRPVDVAVAALWRGRLPAVHTTR
jgi:TonB family protein